MYNTMQYADITTDADEFDAMRCTVWRIWNEGADHNLFWNENEL